MAFQGGKEEASSDFNALNDFVAPVEVMDSQDWIDSSDQENARDALPRIVGKIPNVFLEEPSCQSSALKNAFQRIFILAAVFGLGFLASTSLHGLTANQRESSNKLDVAQNEPVDVKISAPESSGEDVLGASLKFDAFASENAVPFDDLYGTGFVAEPESTSLANSIDPSFHSDQTDLDYDDALPTWADLAPRDQNSESGERPASARAGAFVTEEASERPFDKQSANAIPNGGITDARPVAEPIDNPSAYDYASVDNAFLAQTPSNAPGFAQQSSQNFQPFSAGSDNNNVYVDNNNYHNDSVLNSSANSARYVDDSRNADYNSRKRDNGYSASAVNQNAYAQIAPSSAPTDVELAGEQETPAYVSSIPTFNNPRPGENANSATRPEYVAQTSDESSRQKPTSKPTRALRW